MVIGSIVAALAAFEVWLASRQARPLDACKSPNWGVYSLSRRLFGHLLSMFATLPELYAAPKILFLI